ncbi:MAG: flippase-like domain-containing protein [Nitrospina sp.]|nr:flippase-like domain-containing protein [Nitrospina sp.]
MKYLKLFFLLIGCLLLAWAISTVNLFAVVNLLIKLGYGFLIVLILYGIVTWVDTIAWKNNFKREETRQFSLWSLWCIRQIGEAYNTITPLGTLGGEPIKAQLLKEKHGLSLKQGMASQVIARTTFLIGLILFFIPGIFFTLQSNVIPNEIKGACILSMAILSILIFLFLIFQITGTLGKLARWSSKRPFGKKMNVFLKKLEILDESISSYYRQDIRRAIISVSYAFIGWVIGMAELYVTLYFLGYNLSLTDLWLIEALAQLIRNASFFIPLSIGAQEGGLLLIFTALGLPGTLGITVSFVRRIKELLWVCLGLAIGWGIAFNQKEL